MSTPEHPDDVLTLDQAAEALHVDREQAAAMVEQGLLVATEGDGEPRFTRAAVEAVRLAGG